MRWIDAIGRVPIPYDRARGQDAAAPFAHVPGPIGALLAGAAGCSGHIARLLATEGGWLASTLDLSIDDALADAGILAPDPSPEASLRQAKRRSGLILSLADLGGVLDLAAVTRALTGLADRCVQAGLSHLVAAETARGRLPATLAPDGGAVALAMGKMGAHELNYSSDIDLILLFDEAAHAPDAVLEARAGLIRVTQRLVRLLSEPGEGGYVFRTDLRLRPDPSVTPVCIGIEAAENYYEAFGRTWERAAMIKARPCAGDIAAGERFLAAIRPFVWRRHLDFAAIRDAQDMRLRIRDHKGLGGPFRLDGHNVKLGMGGIRAIEFFVQTRQLITGGRDDGLRQRGTLEALQALAARGWVEAGAAEDLARCYRDLRALEHRLQMLEDQQTHALPAGAEGFARLAAFMGEADAAALRARLEALFAEVHALTEPFFDPARPAVAVADIWAGFADPGRARDLAAEWQKLPSLRSERAQVIFRDLLPDIATRLARAASPDEALVQFDAFLRGLPSGVQLFSLFQANPQLMDLLVNICATAPALARHLGRQAQVFDAVLSPGFYQPVEPVADLVARVTATMAAEADYERALDAARRFAREQRFRIGVQLLTGVAGVEEAARGYSALAEAVLVALYPAVVAEFARRHGPPPGEGAAILGLGKLGSGEMTATSDLDLIVIYDAGDAEQSGGPKPLAVRPYYARLTQALVAALTAPTAEGVLYRVDMRLRPSGRQGPVAVSLPGFLSYQLGEAWTWEHLALTRARVCGGAPPVAGGVAAALDAVRAAPRDAQAVLADVAQMRARLAGADVKAGADPWEVKSGPGRMLDIELVAQAGALLAPGVRSRAPRAMLRALGRAGWLPRPQAAMLDDALGLYRAVQQAGRLATEDAFHPDSAGAGLTALVLRLTGAGSVAALAAVLAQAAADADRIISARLGGGPA
jgi:glutamate-ammonia-ligase adenylyltransferase